jgi:hypothetical protein
VHVPFRSPALGVGRVAPIQEQHVGACRLWHAEHVTVQ